MTSMRSICWSGLLALALAAMPAFAKTVPLAGDCPKYEQRIDELGKKLAEASGARRNDMNRRYVDFVRELDRLDANTRFTMCTDQDGAATLKFNTPEEQRRDDINRILGWVDWFSGKLTSLAGAGEEVATDALLTKVKDGVGKLQKGINNSRASGMTQKGDFDTVVQEYRRLKKTRRDAIDNLNRMADQALCHGLTPEEMELAELYHDTIPNNHACNPLVKKALRDRIRRIPTVGFGSIFDLATYRKMQAECRVGPSASPRTGAPGTSATGWNGDCEEYARLGVEQAKEYQRQGCKNTDHPDYWTLDYNQHRDWCVHKLAFMHGAEPDPGGPTPNDAYLSRKKDLDRCAAGTGDATRSARCAALYRWWQKNECDHWGIEGKLFIPQEKWAIHDECFRRLTEVNRCKSAGQWPPKGLQRR